MSTEHSVHYKAELQKGNIKWLSDTFKVCYMESGFVFDPTQHATWADISANELAAGNGYSQDTLTLSNISITEDNTNKRAVVTCNDVSVTANGGTLGPTPGAIIYDDTSSDDTVCCYMDFGGEVTKADGTPLAINDITIIQV